MRIFIKNKRYIIEEFRCIIFTSWLFVFLAPSMGYCCEYEHRKLLADGNAVYYYHYDGLGSVTALSDDSGVLIEKYSYDVFGAVTIRDANDSVISVSSVANPFMFTGREYDSETGNYYHRARYYKPSIGRFLQTDPIGYNDSINLYQYCLNNSVNFTDPGGKWIETVWDATNVGMGAVSLVSNVKHGNYGWAALDAVGLIYDTAATAVPFLPGGAGAAFKAARAGNKVLESINVGMDVAKIAKQTDRAAHIADEVSSAASYGRRIHNGFEKVELKAFKNHAPIGWANRGTGIKPDFVGNGIWADITTPGLWQKHLGKYSDDFGQGIPILYQRGKGVANMTHLYPGAGIGLTAARQSFSNSENCKK